MLGMAMKRARNSALAGNTGGIFGGKFDRLQRLISGSESAVMSAWVRSLSSGMMGVGMCIVLLMLRRLRAGREAAREMQVLLCVCERKRERMMLKCVWDVRGRERERE